MSNFDSESNEIEEQCALDDDYEVVNHYYRAKSLHPNIPFYLQDENGETFVFGWDLIYQYIKKMSEYNYPDW